MNKKVGSETVPLDGLVGRFFHSFGDDNEANYQGQVIARIDDRHYLVQLFEWFAGKVGR